jgi:hypothetical protein
MTIGGFDQEKYSSGKMAWIDIAEDEWSIGLNSVTVNEDLVR